MGEDTKNSNTAKFIGLVFCGFLIFIGVFYPSDKNIKDESKELEKELLCFTMILADIDNLVSKYERELDEDSKKAIITPIIDKIDNINRYMNFSKKIEVANVFFQHVLKLIFILSGIFGLFWISIWKYREDREKKESQEKKGIQEEESVEREKKLIAEERLKILELVLSKKKI